MTESQSRYLLSRRSLIVGVAAAATASLLPSSARAAPAIGDLAGAFKHAGGARELRMLHAAIAQAISDFNVFVRGVARKRLLRANPVPRSLALAVDGRSFMISYDAEMYAAPLDGKPVKVRSSAGEDMILRARTTKAGVEQVFSTGDKSRVNRFSIVDGRLAVDVTVRAAQLPRALSYRLTYARG